MTIGESIDQPWGASVFGAASVEAAPDVARLRVSINETRQQPADAFDAVRAAVTRVRQVLRERGIPDAAISTSQVNLKSSWKVVAGDHVFDGYTSSASFSIELRQLDQLEPVLVEVVAAGADTVEGVTFDVRAKQRLRAEARRAAVAAAREKAALYAESAGVRLGPVIHIKDIDAEQLRSYRGHGQAAIAGLEGDLLPGNVSVSAGVVLGFSLIGS